MRKLAACALIVGLTLLLTPTATGATPPTATPATGQQNWVRLSLESMQPRVVGTGDTSVTVAVTITNTSDRVLHDVTARLQLAPAVTAESTMATDLATAADGNTGVNISTTTFVHQVDALVPGQTVQFGVTEPLHGAHSLLNTAGPGVYPLLVNVQGTPDFGRAARIGTAGTLLPVLAGAHPPTAEPARLTMLWPLVDDQPRVVGTSNGQLVLSDDRLAGSLGPGGRLYGLLDAVNQVAASQPNVLSALCFAIDPDLLDTVTRMTGGYLVRTNGGTTAGTGAGAATAWLATLKTLTAQHCVLSLPYADADLAALAHADGVEPLKLALGTTVEGELGTKPVSGIAWPADGVLDGTTMTALAGLGVHTVLLNQDAVTPAATATAPISGQTGRMVPIDGVASDALTGWAGQPNVSEAGVSAQDGLGALVYQSVFESVPGRSLLIAPPRRWSVAPGEAQQFLQEAATLLASGYAAPAGLAEVGDASTGPVTLAYPGRAAAAEVDHGVVTSAVKNDTDERAVQDAMARDHTSPSSIRPDALIGPLRLGLLRAVSSAWRNGNHPAASAALDNASSAFTQLAGMVSVQEPSLPISLGSQSSRLPVAVHNALPVDITVNVELTPEPGLPQTGLADALIPANTSRTLLIPTKMTRSGRFSVYAYLTTPDGTRLGGQARFELVSSAYGTIILIVTATAFGLLVLLSGRRIFRRVRAARAATAKETRE